MLSSSLQAVMDNPYGVSKKAGEDLLFEYAHKRGAKLYVYRLPNVFGKWCKPNYNSVVATFANNIANDLPIVVNDPNVSMNLIYIDDLLNELMGLIRGISSIKDGFCYIEPVYTVKLGQIVEMLNSFKYSRINYSIPNTEDEFTRKLYATYISYLPINKLSYKLKMNVDNRGSFSEFIKTTDRGQVSINVSKPGVMKGNHWHHSKCEKFLVVSGKGLIRLRKINTTDVIEYKISGDIMEVIDIPPGYVHSIVNIGDSDMVTVIWVNTIFDPENPDTISMEV